MGEHGLDAEPAGDYDEQSERGSLGAVDRLMARPMRSGGYEQSASIAKLSEALAQAQGEIEHASKDGRNPHYKSSYATLASVVDACRLPLAKAKIAVHQPPLSDGDLVGVRTMLMHASGEWVASTIWCRPVQPGPQAVGSVLTYLRRYALAAAVGIAQQDDDAEQAHGRKHEAPQATPGLIAQVTDAVKRLQAVNPDAAAQAAQDVMRAGLDAPALSQIAGDVEAAIRRFSQQAETKRQQPPKAKQ